MFRHALRSLLALLALGALYPSLLPVAFAEPSLDAGHAGLTEPTALGARPSNASASPEKNGNGPGRTHLQIREFKVNDGLPPPAEALDLASPLRAWNALLGACKNEKYELGMHVLTHNDVAMSEQARMAPGLTRQLCEVIRVLPMTAFHPQVDDYEGPFLDGRVTNRSTAITVIMPDGDTEELFLSRVQDTGTGKFVWMVNRRCVAQIPVWYQVFVRGEAVAVRPDADRLNAAGPIPADWKIQAPRRAVLQFMALAKQDRYDEAARLLDLTAIPVDQQPVEGPRLARRLARLLPVLRQQPLEVLSNSPRGAPEVDLNNDEELVASASESAEGQLLLRRYPRAAGKAVWLFSFESVGRIDSLYAQYGQGWFGDNLSHGYFAYNVLWLQPWQWLVLLGSFLIAGLGGFILAWLLQRICLLIAGLTQWRWDEELAAVMRGPLGLLITAFILRWLTFKNMALTGSSSTVIANLCMLTSVLALGWLAIRLVDVASSAMTRSFLGRNDHLATAMVPVVRRVLKPILFVLVVVISLQNMGVNVGGLLAGLGIGGIAVALAGKTSLENLIGSIAIAFDRPFRIGDLVKVGEVVGYVEELGLRSTRVRTYDRTIVTIPNGELAMSRVENYGVRDTTRHTASLEVHKETTGEQLRGAIESIRASLAANPNVWQESFMVNYSGPCNAGFQPALRIEMVLWLMTTDLARFAEQREEVMLRVAEILREQGIRLA